MDGLRKVPDNIPNQDMLKIHVDKPLSKVPDPFENIIALQSIITKAKSFLNQLTLSMNNLLLLLFKW